MWEKIDARIEDNERDNSPPAPLRRPFFEAIQTSGLLPGTNATKKMVALSFGSDERLLWEIQSPARNFFLHARWENAVQNAALQSSRRPFVEGQKDGGRHSALSREWAFGKQDCIAIEVRSLADLQRLLTEVLAISGELMLAPEAIDRWVSRLREFFPSFRRFDEPDPDFDDGERYYKFESASILTEGLAEAESDSDIVDAVHRSLKNTNLLTWRAYDALSPNSPVKREKLGAALKEMAEAARQPAEGHPAALASFVDKWMEIVPEGQTDHARQIAEFILMHLSPNDGVYIRHTVRQDFWLEAIGSRFPASSDFAEIYALERRFMLAVRDAFEKRGLRPRDMIDVQSALWVVHNYGDEEMPELDAAAPTKGESAAPLNLILYGPPGTGKTYATAAEAVRLCDQLPETDPILSESHRRADLMARYRELVSEGRVQFTTFHQSYSYEEFVEGLRPTTGSRNNEEMDSEAAAGTSSAGFRLVPHDGLFKAICERARLDTGDTQSADRLDRTRHVFKVALGARSDQAELIQQGLDNSVIHLGWGGNIDWSDARFDGFESIRAEWNDKIDPNATGKDANIEQIYALRSSMQIGDYVAISGGRDVFIAFGRVTGEYFFDTEAESHPHKRPVEWLWRDPTGLPREAFYPRNFRRHSIYKLDPDAINWDGLESSVLQMDAVRPTDEARDHVLIIDEINRANISKVFGELITLLEPDKRLGQLNEIRLKLPYSGSLFGVPANLHIIGTMNTADRSIALLDTALRRRFHFRELMPDPTVLSDDVDGIDMQRMLTVLNERIEYLFDREHQIGHAYFTGCNSQSDVEEVMRHNVIPLLAEYFYEDWSRIASVLGDQPNGNERFLRCEKMAPLGATNEEDDGSERLRWSVKESFDFSEFM